MKPIYTCILLGALSIWSVPVSAQLQGDVYRQFNNTKVMDGAKQLKMPWTGGVNSPQFAMADLNHDGKNDLVIFEKEVGTKTLICTAPGVYTYNSNYEKPFAGVYNYIKLIDFNGDKIPDLVHWSNSGAGISYGYYDTNNELDFKYYKELKYLLSNYLVNLSIGTGSIPGMADVDGDGDIDILSYDVSGTSITFYRNCSKEENLHPDSIKICLKDWCWGKTYQPYTRSQGLGVVGPCLGTHNPTCKGCGAEAKVTHGDNTICLIDIDDDGDLDYFNGNQDFPDIQFLHNGKSQYGVDSIISQDTIWSANGVDMYMPIFPVASALDIDQDNDLDLLFSPTNPNTENYNSISLYENTGTPAHKNYVFKKRNYLVDEMIDHGRGSYPVFYDYDKDGKKDLFVGSDGYYDYATNKNISRIAYYRNTTSSTGSYSFELQTNNFLNLDALNFEGASLAIGDLDNDSLADLVIGHSDGTFSFFKNHALSDTLQPVWTLDIAVLRDQSTLKTLDVGDFATPCIYDIDKDGKNDLISGNQFGDLYYFNNFGANPGFVGLKQITANLGGVKITNANSTYFYSAPYIGPTDDTKIDYLVVGSDWGKLLRFDGFQAGTMPAKFTMIDSNYSYVNVGKRSAPAFADVDNDNVHLHEMVVGTLTGGLKFYKQDFKVHINERIAGNKNVRVYPNPAGNVLNVKWDADFNQGEVTVQLVSVTGQVIIQQTYEGNTGACSLVLNEMPSGIYYCVIQSGSDKSVIPVSVLK